MRNVKCYDSDGNILKLLYQWDCNQTLYFTGIPTSPTPVFHFCNKNSVEALVVNSTRMDDGVIVDVPNILLQDSDPLIIFIYLNTGNDGGRTIHAMQVPVVKRAKPDDYEYTDNTPIITASFVNARLSELISEISDGAEGDLAVEVYDIRVGADGTVYQTAGDAVRYLEQDVRSIQAEIDEIERGLSESAKQALLSCFQHVAWIDEHGQDYYNDLYDALYTTASIRLDTHFVLLNSIGATSQLIATTVPVGGRVTWTSSDTSVATVTANGLVTSVGYGDAIITASSGSVSATCGVSVAEATVLYISAVYTPSGNVYTTDTLDSLKSDLVVTAAWSNGSTTTVQDSYYELSGTLNQGTNVITVSFGGKTDTFEVEAIESVESISATFNSDGVTIYTDDSLDDLKQYLTVTYTFNGNDTVLEDSDYVLSGTLVAGTNTITVSKDGKTTTFDVTVQSALDRIAYGNLTYRDIFIDGNYFTLQGFENIDVVPSVETSLPNGDTFYGSFGNPLPSIDTEHVKSGTHSLKASGTISSQVKYTTLKLPIEGKVLIACNVYVNRYVKGMCGVQFNARTDSSHAITKSAGVSQITNDFVTALTVQDYDLSEGSQSTVTTEVYCGTWSSANADAYVDDVVVSIVPAEMTFEIATQLYNNYLNMI